ncbi:TauD/TfdA dioxygenase family protein [Sphingomonas jatrophae]|uniref:Taurine dioxygenase n=1 Tax=Sphingomonas jatrophae TaxID=1166337 RepID=A0A1I6KBD3_9SPHN|nr:TauD/TfdA family dioxygenase [Sphingomonas jatrophae]SFR88562.1 taurine dioxygenase [Sphingomonas jatrophae]
MSLRTRALPTIGQEVLDLDLDTGLDEATEQALRDLWREAGLVLFRGVGTEPERLRRLSRVFGELEPHPIPDFRLPGHPDMILLTNRGGLRGPVYAFDGVPTYGRIPWHTDLAFSTTPNAGALLNMVEKAAVGGRTAWLDTQAACAAMDPALRERLDGVEALFEFCADLGGMRFDNPGGVRVGETKASFPDFAPIARPILFRHPETGAPILNVCPLNIRSIVGLAQAEGDALIEALIAAVTDPRFVYEHDWAEGDVMLWDNYRMMHRAEGHPVDVPRVVHRTTLRGTATVGRTVARAA